MRKLTYAFALLLTLAALLLVLAPRLPAQTTDATSLAFDVVSIKRSTSGPGLLHYLTTSLFLRNTGNKLPIPGTP